MNQAKVNPVIIDVLREFLERGFLTEAQCNKFSTSSSRNLRLLIENGLVPERVFAETLGAAFDSPIINREQLPTTAIVQAKGLEDFLIEHEALPLSFEAGVLHVAMSDPSDEFTSQVLRSKLKCKLKIFVSLRGDILESLSKIYFVELGDKKNATTIQSGKRKSNTHVDLPDDLDTDSKLVRELHRLIQRAVSVNASDIHFEPIDSRLRVRFRVHGMLQEIHNFEPEYATQVIARLKLMSKLDVTQRRQAQNGRFKFPADGRVIDLRVSTLPLHDGESIVLRLLELGLSQLSLRDLGFTESVADSIQHAISGHQGLILITGPTGSGKSTTLYSLLNQLNVPELKLISIEDPVEINIAGINQIQVNQEHGVSFSAALKTVLRQDPDIIMIGEIRDSETAKLAVQAALTGHLVFATLHTGSAASAITRLENLDVPKYLLVATVKAVLAQRLIRSVCTECVGQNNTSECGACFGVGYAGRTSIAEFLPADAFNDDALVREDLLAGNLLGGISLVDDAKRLLAAGVTDSAEVLRVLGITA
jgi:general secretion pathway protein E